MIDPVSDVIMDKINSITAVDGIVPSIKSSLFKGDHIPEIDTDGRPSRLSLLSMLLTKAQLQLYF